MFKKVICHFAIILSVLLILSFIGNKIEKLNPIKRFISDISLSDIYFLLNDTIPSSEIYIVDIGNKDPIKTRGEIATFLRKINKEYKPKVIGVDVYFDSKYKDDSINQSLTTSLSMDNVIRMFKLEELKAKDGSNIFYPDFSFLPGLDINPILKDGYTNGLGAITQHACIRHYKPNYEIEGKNYNHFSKLIAQKYLNQTPGKLSSEKIEDKIMINYNTDFTKNRIDINDSTRYHELEDKIVLIGLNTYRNDGSQFYNEDLHFTPENENYIGRSAKDTYGIEILATIISNRINDDHFSYSETFINWINWIISIAFYIFLLFIFTDYNKYFVFLKIFIQTIGIVLLAFISIIIMFSNYYIDLTPAIGMIFISAQFMKFVENVLQKIPKYNEKIKT